MGNYFTVNMEENFKKNQEFIQTINKIKVKHKCFYFDVFSEKNITAFVLDGKTNTTSISTARKANGHADSEEQGHLLVVYCVLRDCSGGFAHWFQANQASISSDASNTSYIHNAL